MCYIQRVVKIIEADFRTCKAAKIEGAFAKFAFTGSIYSRTLEDIKLLHKTNNGVEKENSYLQEMAISHMISSGMNLCIWWIDHDLKLPITKIVEICNNIIIRPAQSLLPWLNAESNKKDKKP